MVHRNAPILAGVALSASLAVAGCGGDGQAAGDAVRPAASRTPAATPSPYGTYVRRVTKGDIARTRRLRSEAGPTQSLPLRGRYRLTIAKGAAQSVLKATDPSGFTIDMDVNVRGGELETTSYVDPSRASFCGPEMPVASTYRFRAGATSLRLSAHKDGCADRDSILTGTWTRG